MAPYVFKNTVTEIPENNFIVFECSLLPHFRYCRVDLNRDLKGVNDRKFGFVGMSLGTIGFVCLGKMKN